MSRVVGAASVVAGAAAGAANAAGNGGLISIVVALIGAAGLIGAAVATRLIGDRLQIRKHERYDAVAVNEHIDPSDLLAKLVTAHEEIDRLHGVVRGLRHQLEAKGLTDA